MDIVWKIEWMKCIPQIDDVTDYVIECGWRCIGSQDGFSASNYGSCGFSVPPSDNVTPYADLTEDQVLGWVWADGVDKDATEASVTGQVQALINPPVVQPPLPWAAQGQ